MLRVRNIIYLLALVGLLAFQTLAYAENPQNVDKILTQAGAQIEISILDENALSGRYEIDDGGNILMPLIGKVHIAGLDASEIEHALIARFKDGYILDPIISVRSVSPEPHEGFYILGEVKNPGHYFMPKGPLNILNAVALAGGFTYRARQNNFDIKRKTEDGEETYKNNNSETEFFPGDIIIVKERFF